jgi:putative selenate reductase FAD-binding subunit
MGSRPSAAYLGGGTWVNSGSVGPSGPITRVISLEALGLDGVRRKDTTIRIGAGTRFQDMIDAGGLPAALADALKEKASRTLRNMITLGGEIGFSEAQSCVIPALIALDAKILLAGEGGEKAMDKAPYIESGELILEVTIPDDGKSSAFRGISRTSHSRKSLVFAVALHSEGGVLRDLRVVIGDCVAPPLRLLDVEDELEGKNLPEKEKIETLVRKHFAPAGDFHASAEYKRYMAGVIVADTLHDLISGEVRS